MLEEIALTMTSVIIVSLISLIGVLFISVKESKLRKIILYFVSFAAGALFGDAFIHLIPEAAGAGFTISLSVYIIAGIVGFLIVEKVIRWRHCHVPTTENHPHPIAYMNLIGDAVHNFIDGLIIGASYLAGMTVGIATTIAVILHEIPQEIGDFGVLIHGGFSRKKAIAMNFLTALTAVAGAAVALLIGFFVMDITSILIPFAAGGFIYIAGTDLIPELHKECEAKTSFKQILMFIVGIAVMALLVFVR